MVVFWRGACGFLLVAAGMELRCCEVIVLCWQAGEGAAGDGVAGFHRRVGDGTNGGGKGSESSIRPWRLQCSVGGG